VKCIALPAVEDLEIEGAVPSSGIKRTISVFDSAGSELIGPTLGYIVIGIVASVSLAIFLPHGYLQHQVNHDNALAPILVAAVATPIYSTPLLAMSQIGGMFQHGNSIGAAFSLLILGAGVNLGLLTWFGRTYGAKRVVMFFLLLVTTTVGLAYLIDKPLYPKGVEPAGHTHAFDVYTNPFSGQRDGIFTLAQEKMADFWASNELGGTYLLGLLVGLGLIFRFAFKRASLESWYQQADEKESKLNLEVPSWILGITVVTGLVFASVVGSYLYYPAPDDILPDLSSVNVEAVLCSRTQDWEAAEKWIAFCDNLSRRVEVGVYLRNGSVSEFKTGKARIYRDRLEDLKMAVQRRSDTNIAELGMDVQNAYRRMRDAFTEEGASQ